MIKIKYLITGALPYVNFDLHFGHVVACLLRPDIYTRFLRLKNEDVISICGSDEYGTPSLVAAEKEGISPQKLCDKYHAIQKASIEKLNIKFDNFSRTTTPEHIKTVQDVYYDLKQNNFIYRKDIEELYCEKCKRSLPDRYVKGICPYCNSEKARGDQCETCGKVLEPMQLKKATCINCNEEPILRNSEHVFFELSKLNDELLKWVQEQDHWPNNAKSFALNWLREGLKDKDISRDLPWGVPIPDAEGLVFYVWFDAPLGYITFSRQIGKESWWKDNNTRIINFIGKDNIAFHTISFPGVLKAQGKYNLPYQISSCEFLNYEGGKFSKSEQHGFFLKNAVELYPADYWRYYISTIIPDSHDTSFEWKEFQEKINSDLNDTFGNLIHRTLTFAEKYFENKVEKPELSEIDNEILKQVKEKTKKIEKLMYDIELKKALIEIINIARIGNQFITKEEPWKNEDRRQNVVYVSLSIAKVLSVILEPFIPESSNKLKEFLNLKNLKWDNANLLEDKFEINEFKPLFKKIDNDELEEKIKIFKNEKKEGKPMIKYDDFSKLELKVAEVKSVEKIEGADKLYKIKAQIGNEERTIVAGMAPYYKKEDLIGRKIIVLTNLEPRKLKGIESNGMLLAAESKDGKVKLLTIDGDIETGAEIR